MSRTSTDSPTSRTQQLKRCWPALSGVEGSCDDHMPCTVTCGSTAAATRTCCSTEFDPSGLLWPIGADPVSKTGSGGCDAHQWLATALATSFDSLGGSDPATCWDSSARRRSDRPERQCGPVGGAAVDRASLGRLWVRPWPSLGPPRISSRVKVAHYRVDWCRGRESNPHDACASQDFKSCASASFATPATGNSCS